MIIQLENMQHFSIVPLQTYQNSSCKDDRHSSTYLTSKVWPLNSWQWVKWWQNIRKSEDPWKTTFTVMVPVLSPQQQTAALPAVALDTREWLAWITCQHWFGKWNTIQASEGHQVDVLRETNCLKDYSTTRYWHRNKHLSVNQTCELNSNICQLITVEWVYSCLA